MKRFGRNYEAVRQWFSASCRQQRLLVVLFVLGALGLVKEGWEAAASRWGEFRRPKAIFTNAFPNGMAISLNGLEQAGATGLRFPGLRIRGVLWDQGHHDWVIFGDAAPDRLSLSVDAVAIALRAVRQELEAPGVDIRPNASPTIGGEVSQKVTYFGGVSNTVVGDWFFRFDYWMKRKSLGLAEETISGIPGYWDNAVSALEQEVEICNAVGSQPRRCYNRYWLQAGDFRAVESDDVLAFDQTAMLVDVESRREAIETTSIQSAATARTNSVDPLAARFARQLTDKLDAIGGVTPILQIEDFAVLMAGFTWLSSVDSYRDLRPWLNRPLAHTETPHSVSNLVMRAVREHPMRHATGLHQHVMELSGGVVIHPRLIRFRVADQSLAKLRDAILKARPDGKLTFWEFSFKPQ